MRTELGAIAGVLVLALTRGVAAQTDTPKATLQVWWHDSFGFAEPRGWAHQVRTRVGVIGIFDKRVALAELAPGGRRVADVLTQGAVQVGNIFTGATGGGTIRVGYNLSREWEKIEPTRVARLGGLATMDAERQEPAFEIHGFLTAQAKLVAWNALLQGRTYSPCPSLPIERVIGDVEYGVVIRYLCVSTGIRFVLRSPEFGGAARDDFGLFLSLGGPRR